jgi:2-C-methyl-D-erythritol 4-phosphate cytidylyltransferase
VKRDGGKRIGVVIAAGGSGRRIGGVPKQFRDVGGRPLLAWSCARFSAHDGVGPIVVVLPDDLVADPPPWLGAWDVRVVAGGATRRDSVRAGLAGLDETIDSVMIHDAARPFVSEDLLDRMVASVGGGPVVPVVPLADTIKRMRSRRGEDATLVEGTVDREQLRGAQTPQGFPFGLICELHEQAARDGILASDDAMLCERAGVPVRGIPGERWAWKVTQPEDLALAKWLVASGRVPWPGDPDR